MTHYICVMNSLCMNHVLITLCLHTGLWKQWFLKMFRGEKLPKMPDKPSEMHKRAGVRVPYTSAEMKKRTEAYAVRKATWDKTMKVNVFFS
jgi:hypothetical protein